MADSQIKYELLKRVLFIYTILQALARVDKLRNPAPANWKL